MERWRLASRLSSPGRETNRWSCGQRSRAEPKLWDQIAINPFFEHFDIIMRNRWSCCSNFGRINDRDRFSNKKRLPVLTSGRRKGKERKRKVLENCACIRTWVRSATDVEVGGEARQLHKSRLIFNSEQTNRKKSKRGEKIHLSTFHGLFEKRCFLFLPTTDQTREMIWEWKTMQGFLLKKSFAAAEEVFVRNPANMPCLNC